MKNKTIKIIATVALLLIVSAVSTDILAQCPMCKMAAESNLKNGGTAGAGLNKGILFMFAMPYLLVGTFAYIWIRNRKTEGDEWEEIVE